MTKSMHLIGTLALGGLLSSCHSNTKLSTVDFSQTPRLPSPISGIYTRHLTLSSDPVVESICNGRKIEASLTGAAAGLALRAINEDGGLSGWEVRESLWQAGYPYPVESVHGWSTNLNQGPPTDLLDWIASRADHEDIGLVRARGAAGMAWVGLRATPIIDIGAQPRQVELGSSIVLPAIERGRYRVSDPTGAILAGPMQEASEFRLMRSGEWLFEIRLENKLAGLFPVYAGLEPPNEPIFEANLNPTMDVNIDSISKQASLQFEAVREAYGLQPWRSNILLNKAAAATLRGKDGQKSAQAVGYEESSQLSCTATTVEDCLDSLIWDPELRPLLLSEGPSEIGIAAKISQQNLSFAFLVSPETL